MLEKISVTEKQWDNLAKGIAVGTGLGIVIGAIVGQIVLLFSAGGVIGIIVSLIYSWINDRKKNKIKEVKIN